MMAAADAGQATAANSARKLLGQAQAQFAASAKALDEQLAKMPKLVGPEEAQLKARKHQLAGDLAEARLMGANVEYELAKTYDSKSSLAKEHFHKAAGGYAALHDTYRTRAVGLLARLWEGRCYQELGKFTEALGCYRELMDLPDTPETARFAPRARGNAMECWISDR